MRLIEFETSMVEMTKVRALVALGHPTEVRLNRVFVDVYREPNTILYVALDAHQVVGVVGIRSTGQATAVILHIAVDERRRRLGIGRTMVEELVRKEQFHELTAETDGEAVDIYRRCGFTVHSLGEKYPGVERFLCTFTT